MRMAASNAMRPIIVSPLARLLRARRRIGFSALFGFDAEQCFERSSQVLLFHRVRAPRQVAQPVAFGVRVFVRGNSEAHGGDLRAKRDNSLISRSPRAR